MKKLVFHIHVLFLCQQRKTTAADSFCAVILSEPACFCVSAFVEEVCRALVE